MYLTKEEVLAQTNGGLQVILDLFPEANECLDQKKKFKLRNEKNSFSKTEAPH